MGHLIRACQPEKYKRESLLEFMAKGKKKKPFLKEETFCLQMCASNISKIKINTEDGLSWYPRGNKKKHFSGN